MILSFDVRPECRERIPAVTHVDGSARVQTVDRGQGPGGTFRRLIEAFDSRTGVPIVLNTSFNRRGEPIVCSPTDAVKSFLAEEMDRLVLGPFVARKPGAPSSTEGRAARENRVRASESPAAGGTP